MIRFEDTVSVTMSVVFRKSAHVFRQFACLFVDLISVLTSALRYYGMLQRRRSTVLYGSRYHDYFPTSSSMAAVRHDR
ncbi:hypothetical protein AB3S75_030609 [Citrus x aurantiifolia]